METLIFDGLEGHDEPSEIIEAAQTKFCFRCQRTRPAHETGGTAAGTDGVWFVFDGSGLCLSVWLFWSGRCFLTGWASLFLPVALFFSSLDLFFASLSALSLSRALSASTISLASCC